MGLYCDEKAGDKFIEGTVDCLAVLHKDSPPAPRAQLADTLDKLL
ncbi:hypothetical protein FBX97_5578 [Herbaspirillum sp. SJZ107]|nr:hypothetical protein FBX97_5578 [Herbaspirillum sp. SJZ107]